MDFKRNYLVIRFENLNYKREKRFFYRPDSRDLYIRNKQGWLSTVLTFRNMVSEGYQTGTKYPRWYWENHYKPYGASNVLNE